MTATESVATIAVDTTTDRTIVTDLEAAGRAWARAKEKERDRMAELYAAIIAYCADGGSEAEAARIAGVDRMTVRRALGKR